MDAQVKAKWIAALKSGNYKQGKGVLADPKRGEHCCLGVLCELAAAEGLIRKANDGRYIEFDGASHVLPGTVARWAGLEYPDGRPMISPIVPERHVVDGCVYDNTTLASLNDDDRAFTEIANLIERHL